MSDLPYRYSLMIKVEIEGNGVHAFGNGAKATADRLAELLETDDRVTAVNRWPAISYLGQADGE